MFTKFNTSKHVKKLDEQLKTQLNKILRKPARELDFF